MTKHLFLLASVAGYANAAIVTISTSDAPVQVGVDNQGWISSTRINTNNTNDNYVTGPTGGDQLNNFLGFSLGAIPAGENVTSLTLRVRRYNTESTATITFSDVSADLASLRSTIQNGVLNAAQANDLANGVSYGTFNPGVGVSEDILTFILNSAAIADINTAIANNDSYFVIGGSATGGLAFGASGGEPGNSATNFTQELVVVTSPVPEPSSALLSFAALGLLVVRRRK